MSTTGDGERPAPLQMPEWLRRIIDARLTVHVVVVIGAVVAGINGLVKTTPSKWVCIGMGTALLVVARLLEQRRTRLAAEKEIRYQEDVASATEAARVAVKQLILVLGDYFSPIAELLARMSGTTNKAELRTLSGVLTQKIVEAAAAICGPSGHGIVRANYFKWDGSTLTFETHHGRGEAPRQQLPAVAAALAQSRGAALVPDVKEAPNPEHFESATYQTFVSCAVYSGETIHGLLTVDSSEAGTLRKQDLRTAIVLSHMLGAGLALRK